MSVLTPKRLFLCVVALLIGTSAFASHPSPRTLARMAYDPNTNLAVLFGGQGYRDGATGLTHSSAETWLWTGAAWVQRFPATTPPARAGHTMTYDPVHRRVLMFAGRQEATEVGGRVTYLDDLWAWQGDNWVRVDADVATRPVARQQPGMAYDPERDRLVVFGGIHSVIDEEDVETPTSLFDTWVYSGSTWTRIANDELKVVKPLLAWDPIAKQIVMIGLAQADAKPVMYRLDAAANSWVAVAAPKLPTCVNEGYLVVQTSGRLLFLGGVCPSGTSQLEEGFEFDGSTWNKLPLGAFARGVSQAVTYDTRRDRVVLFGGTLFAQGGLLSFTTVVRDDYSFRSAEALNGPNARSFPAFERNPLGQGLHLYGGLTENGAGSYDVDSWQYRDGQWFSAAGVPTSPAECTNPLSTYDTDRNRMIVLCSGRTIHEFDGVEWKDFPELKDTPAERRFAAIAYDQKLKKVVLFGGFFNNNYRNDTWTWDGAKWQEVKIDNDERPPHRGSIAMWYDPLQQKTIVYGGVGRANINQKVTRYSDMWVFDGTRWTKLDVAQTPGIRFRPQVRVNPNTGKLLLFGGLRAEPIDEDSIRQYFEDDTWEWDGSTNKWTELSPATQPPPRQNGGLAFDPLTNEMVMFGGYANGFYLSDVWAWNGTNWYPRLEPITVRTRAVR